jgi:hypothetical protein
VSLWHTEKKKLQRSVTAILTAYDDDDDDDDNNNNNNKPVLIGATGVVTRSLRKNLEAVPGKHSIDSLQKTAMLGTAHTRTSIMRKALQCEA